MQIHAHFHINYIIYSDLLIFCRQNVAIFSILYCWFYFEQTASFLDRRYTQYWFIL